MVTTMGAHLQRFFQLALVKMFLAAIALDEDVFSLYDALFGRNCFDPLALFIEPGHIKYKEVRSQNSEVSFELKIITQG